MLFWRRESSFIVVSRAKETGASAKYVAIEQEYERTRVRVKQVWGFRGIAGGQPYFYRAYSVSISAWMATETQRTTHA
jgi:hypothetical protein